MKEEFLTYEFSLEMKLLDFDEKCLGAYNDEGTLNITTSDYWDNKSIEMINSATTANLKCLAPLYQQAFKWIRNKYKFYPHIFSKADNTFIWCIRWYVDEIQKDTLYYSTNTYEEAEISCLKELFRKIKN